MSCLISQIVFRFASQAALAKEQAERNSKANLEKIEENEKRMEVAQSNMKKMLEKVLMVNKIKIWNNHFVVSCCLFTRRDVKL